MTDRIVGFPRIDYQTVFRRLLIYYFQRFRIDEHASGACLVAGVVIEAG